MTYDRDFITVNDEVKLVVFAVETSGAIHNEARQFLKEHTSANSPFNPTIAFQQALQSISVSIHTCRARCVLTARNLLSQFLAVLILLPTVTLILHRSESIRLLHPN